MPDRIADVYAERLERGLLSEVAIIGSRGLEAEAILAVMPVAATSNGTASKTLRLGIG